MPSPWLPLAAFSRHARWYPLLLTLAVLVAYHNALGGPFVFDDGDAIVDNVDLRHLWPPDWASIGAGGDHAAVNGRPVVSLSLALTFALAGLRPAAYHLGNLLVHLGSVLLAYALVRRTMSGPVLAPRFGGHADVLALAGVGLWAVHPVDSEVVDYTIQRTEALMAFFYLAMLYALARSLGATGRQRVGWHAAAVMACALGMASKEVMVTAPVMGGLYLRVFGGRGWRSWWQEYRAVIGGLATGWLVLAALLASGPHGGSIGPGHGIGPWTWALNQAVAVTGYLKLSVWPQLLSIDYGYPRHLNLGDVWLQASVLASLLAALVLAGRRDLPLLWVGGWFFVILAPTSSLVPLLNQVAAERRVYLALLGPIVLAVTAVYRGLHRGARGPGSPSPVPVAILCLGLVAALTARTLQRNREYDDLEGLWRTALKVAPDNPRAHTNLGRALRAQGRLKEAVAHYRKALRHPPPQFPAWDAHSKLGNALIDLGQGAAALVEHRRAVALRPGSAVAQNNLGVALLQLGDRTDAVERLQRSVVLDPRFAAGYFNLGVLLEDLGRVGEARRSYARAVALKPDFAAAHNNLGLLLLGAGDRDGARRHFRQALEYDPEYGPARENLKLLLPRLPETPRSGSVLPAAAGG